MKIGIMQPYFYPYIGYFQLINAVDIYVNLDHISFMPRSYMVRNIIKNDTKININVYKASQNKICKDIYVNFENDYISKFSKTIQNLYGKSLYYDVILTQIIMPSFIKTNQSISEFNLSIIKNICNYLQIKTKIIDSSEGLTTKGKNEGLQDIVKYFNGNVYINAIGGQKLYNKEDFSNQNIDLKFIQMDNTNIDNPYLSILDLLFRYDKKYIQQQLKNYILI